MLHEGLKQSKPSFHVFHSIALDQLISPIVMKCTIYSFFTIQSLYRAAHSTTFTSITLASLATAQDRACNAMAFDMRNILVFKERFVSERVKGVYSVQL